MKVPPILEGRLPHVPAATSPLVRFIRLGLENRALPLSSGQPSPDFFPLEELAEVAPEAIRSGGGRLLYGSNRGLRALRDLLLAWQKSVGLLAPETGTDSLLLVLGSQYGFDLICQALLRPGDAVALDAPCYPDTWCTLLRRGVRPIPVPLDEEGADPDALEEHLRRGERPVLFYTIPWYQNPCGSSLSPARQARFLELAERYDFLIALDDPYRLLSLEGPPETGAELFPRLGFESGRILALGSLSKILAPGIRAGWIATHPVLAEKLAELQEMSLISLPALDALILRAYWERHGLEGQIDRARRLLRSRRDALAEGLLRHAAPWGATVRIPRGGCFLRLILPEGVAASSLAERLAREERVATIPEAAFWPPSETPAPDRFLRLSFSWCRPEELTEAAIRIGAALERGGCPCPRG